MAFLFSDVVVVPHFTCISPNIKISKTKVPTPAYLKLMKREIEKSLALADARSSPRISVPVTGPITPTAMMTFSESSDISSRLIGKLPKFILKNSREAVFDKQMHLTRNPENATGFFKCLPKPASKPTSTIRSKTPAVRTAKLSFNDVFSDAGSINKPTVSKLELSAQLAALFSPEARVGAAPVQQSVLHWTHDADIIRSNLPRGLVCEIYVSENLNKLLIKLVSSFDKNFPELLIAEVNIPKPNSSGKVHPTVNFVIAPSAGVDSKLPRSYHLYNPHGHFESLLSFLIIHNTRPFEDIVDALNLFKPDRFHLALHYRDFCINHLIDVGNNILFNSGRTLRRPASTGYVRKPVLRAHQAAQTAKIFSSFSEFSVALEKQKAASTASAIKFGDFEVSDLGESNSVKKSYAQALTSNPPVDNRMLKLNIPVSSEVKTKCPSVGNPSDAKSEIAKQAAQLSSRATSDSSDEIFSKTFSQRLNIPTGGTIIRHFINGVCRSFTLNRSDGRVFSILNNRNAAKIMFNLSLKHKKFYVDGYCRTPSGKLFSEYDNGFCWLQAFAMFGKIIPTFVEFIPNLNVGCLLQAGLPKSCLKYMHKTGNALYHFDPNKINKLYHANLNFLVGSAMNENKDILESDNIDLIVEGFTKQVIAKAYPKSDNQAVTNILNRVGCRINTWYDRKNDLMIFVYLNTRQKKIVCDLFPHLKFEFKEITQSGHPVFNVVRTVSNFILYKMQEGRHFVDFGGNVATVINSECDDVHICNPVADSRDAKRHIDNSLFLAKSVGVPNNISVCNKLAQHCNHKSDRAVMVEVYDMTLTEMCQAMLAHGTLRLDFILLLPGDLLDEFNTISIFDGGCKITKDGDKVYYYYGDAAEAYTHDLNNLRNIMTDNLVSIDGVAFRKTLETSFGPFRHFSLTKLETFPSGKFEFLTMYDKSEKNKMLVKVPMRNINGMITLHDLIVDRSMLMNLIEYCANCVENFNRKGFEHIMSQYRSRKNYVIYNGKVIHDQVDIPLDLLPGFIGVCLSEGIRLAEKVHYLAKYSYYQYYAPGIFNCMIYSIRQLFLHFKTVCYEKVLDLMDFLFGEWITTTARNSGTKIFDISASVVVKQSLLISANGDVHSIFTENFEKYQQRCADLEQHASEYDTASELSDAVDSGGMGVSDLRIFEKFITKLAELGFGERNVLRFSAKLYSCFDWLRRQSNDDSILRRVIGYFKSLFSLSTLKNILISPYLLFKWICDCGKASFKTFVSGLLNVFQTFSDKVNSLVKIALNSDEDFQNEVVAAFRNHDLEVFDSAVGRVFTKNFDIIVSDDFTKKKIVSIIEDELSYERGIDVDVQEVKNEILEVTSSADTPVTTKVNNLGHLDDTLENDIRHLVQDIQLRKEVLRMVDEDLNEALESGGAGKSKLCDKIFNYILDRLNLFKHYITSKFGWDFYDILHESFEEVKVRKSAILCAYYDDLSDIYTDDGLVLKPLNKSAREVLYARLIAKMKFIYRNFMTTFIPSMRFLSGIKNKIMSYICDAEKRQAIFDKCLDATLTVSCTATAQLFGGNFCLIRLILSPILSAYLKKSWTYYFGEHDGIVSTIIASTLLGGGNYSVNKMAIVSGSYFHFKPYFCNKAMKYDSFKQYVIDYIARHNFFTTVKTSVGLITSPVGVAVLTVGALSGINPFAAIFFFAAASHYKTFYDGIVRVSNIAIATGDTLLHLKPVGALKKAINKVKRMKFKNSNITSNSTRMNEVDNNGHVANDVDNKNSETSNIAYEEIEEQSDGDEIVDIYMKRIKKDKIPIKEYIDQSQEPGVKQALTNQISKDSYNDPNASSSYSIGAIDHLPVDGKYQSVFDIRKNHRGPDISVQLCEELPMCEIMRNYPASRNIVFQQTVNEVENSIQEFVQIESLTLLLNFKKLETTLDKFDSGMKTYRQLQTLVNDSTQFMYVKGQDWVPLSLIHSDIPQTVEFSVTSDRKLTRFDSNGDEFQFTTTEFAAGFSNKKLISMDKFRQSANIIDSNRLSTMKIVNKPPGSGKTTQISQMMFDCHVRGKTCLALTSTKVGKNELIEKLKNLIVGAKPKNVKTVDAFNMNGKKAIVDELYVDECYMSHSGAILMALSNVDFTNCKFFGDENQIPYSVRLTGFEALFATTVFKYCQVTHDSISYRCPADVCYLLSHATDRAGNKMYTNGVYAVGNPNLRTMHLNALTGVANIPIREDTVYAAFTQGEKDELNRFAKKNIAKTVNELQGGTFKNLIVFRLRLHNNTLYNDTRQFITAISRHTETFNYFCPSNAMNDSISNAINKLNTIEDNVLPNLGSDSVFDQYSLVMEDRPFNVFPARPSLSSVHAVNDFMDLTFNGLSSVDYLTRTLRFEYSDIDLPCLEDLLLTPTKSKPYQAVNCKVPILIGKGERSRPDTWKQVILSLSKRNFAAPRLNEDLSLDETANRLLTSLMRCMEPSRLAEYFDVVEPDVNKINSWLLTRDRRKYGNVLRGFDGNDWTTKLFNLKLMIKGDMKPKLDMSSVSEYSPASNIIYYQTMINMFFSPIFLEIFGRIKYCLGDKVILFSGMNLDEMGDLLESRLCYPLNSYNFVEVDFSKFDKSQGHVIKLYEELVYKIFKFSPNIYDNFKLSEYFCRASATCGVNLDLYCQRRTGSPNTWLSNSLATLAMLASVYDLDDIDLIIVSGDDSLIISRSEIENKCLEINNDFGMDAKFLANPVPYFCSKFIIQVDNRIRLVPDPVRFFEKLSTPVTLVQLEHPTLLRERFTSYRDLMGSYFDENVIIAVERFVSLKYNTPMGSGYAAFCYIHCLLSSFKNFLTIFGDDTSIQL
uniref:Polyprotein n=1 Tax=Little cherry virus 1 TaxID=217686 RepID=A0A679GIJ0_9CLOS|nr:polyprotein [Little cherry virus 1]